MCRLIRGPGACKVAADAAQAKLRTMAGVRATTGFLEELTQINPIRRFHPMLSSMKARSRGSFTEDLLCGPLQALARSAPVNAPLLRPCSAIREETFMSRLMTKTYVKTGVGASSAQPDLAIRGKAHRCN
jgi:hypothetical protein